jgi:hypothetical protein
MIKTTGRTLALPQRLPAYSVFKSASIDVSQEVVGSVYIKFATLTALSASVEFRIEAQSASTWHPIQKFKTSIFPPAIATIISAVGTTLTTNNTFFLDPGDIIYTENSNIALSEWVPVVARLSNGLTILDAYQNDQTNSVIYDSGEYFTATLDLASISAIRLVADASITNNITVIAAYLNTGKF